MRKKRAGRAGSHGRGTALPCPSGARGGASGREGLAQDIRDLVSHPHAPDAAGEPCRPFSGRRSVQSSRPHAEHGDENGGAGATAPCPSSARFGARDEEDPACPGGLRRRLCTAAASRLIAQIRLSPSSPPDPSSLRSRVGTGGPTLRPQRRAGPGCPGPREPWPTAQCQARAHPSAPTELVSVEPGFVHYVPVTRTYASLVPRRRAFALRPLKAGIVLIPHWLEPRDRRWRRAAGSSCGAQPL